MYLGVTSKQYCFNPTSTMALQTLDMGEFSHIIEVKCSPNKLKRANEFETNENLIQRIMTVIRIRLNHALTSNSTPAPSASNMSLTAFDSISNITIDNGNNDNDNKDNETFRTPLFGSSSQDGAMNDINSYDNESKSHSQQFSMWNNQDMNDIDSYDNGQKPVKAQSFAMINRNAHAIQQRFLYDNEYNALSVNANNNKKMKYLTKKYYRKAKRRKGRSHRDWRDCTINGPCTPPSSSNEIECEKESENDSENEKDNDNKSEDLNKIKCLPEIQHEKYLQAKKKSKNRGGNNDENEGQRDGRAQRAKI